MNFQARCMIYDMGGREGIREEKEAAPLFPIKKPFERATPAIYERARNVWLRLHMRRRGGKGMRSYMC